MLFYLNFFPYFEGNGTNPFHFLCKYFCHWKSSPETLLNEGKGLRWCGFARFGTVLRKFLFQVVVLQFYKIKRFTVFRNVQVISMRFEVLLCYSVQCLYVLSVWFCSICTPLTPPSLTANNGHKINWSSTCNNQFCLNCVVIGLFPRQLNLSSTRYK